MVSPVLNDNPERTGTARLRALSIFQHFEIRISATMLNFLDRSLVGEDTICLFVNDSLHVLGF